MVKPVVICHQLRSADNLGSIARVMANFGLEELILADPVTHDFRGAERLGVGADGVLAGLAVAPSLDEALGRVVYALGTTSRTALKRFVALSPEEGVERLALHAARGRVALVLGGEKRGLSDDELSRCHDVVAVPTLGPQPSMNVSHAAAVLLYLCTRQPTLPVAEPAGARLETVHALEAKLKEALLACEFLNPQAPEHVLRELSRTLVRGHLSQREAELWLSAFEHVRRVTSRALRDELVHRGAIFGGVVLDRALLLDAALLRGLVHHAPRAALDVVQPGRAGRRFHSARLLHGVFPATSNVARTRPARRTPRSRSRSGGMQHGPIPTCPTSGPVFGNPGLEPRVERGQMAVEALRARARAGGEGRPRPATGRRSVWRATR